MLLRSEEHLFMVFCAMSIGIVIGVPLGIFFTRHKVIGEVFIYFSSIFFTIPSIALFGLMLPMLSIFGHGIGMTPAIIAVVIYSIAPIVRNTYTGINNIDPDLLEAASGMGMTSFQRLIYVEMPISLSTILAGIKISVIVGVATISIGAYIGAGGLGLFIARGISQTDFVQVTVGAISVSFLALALDALFHGFERWTRFLSSPKMIINE